MVSSKGKETDPELKKEVTEEIKQQTNKDGSGKGQMAAWKVSTHPISKIRALRAHVILRPSDNPQSVQIAKEYEARGGDYESEASSKNKPKKGEPEAKDQGATDDSEA